MKTITRKLLAVLTAAVMLCLLIPVGAVSAVASLVQNGGFESGMDGWTCSSAASIVKDADDNVLSLDNPGLWSSAAEQTISVQPNTEYSVTWNSKRVSGSGAFNLFLMNADGYANLQSVRGQNWMNETSGNWVKNEYVVNTGSATSIIIKFSTEATNPGIILLDDVVMTKVGGSDTPDQPDEAIFSSDFESGETEGWTSAGPLSVEDATLKFNADAGWANMLALMTVQANTDYVITFDAKVEQAHGWWVKWCKGDWSGDIVQADVSLTTEWATYSVTLNTGANTNVMLLIQRAGGAASGQTAWFDNITVTKAGGGDTPDQPDAPAGENLFVNGDFESGSGNGWNLWQSTAVTADAAKDGSYGAHLQGNGSWGGMLDQTITVEAGVEYKLTFWIQVNGNGVNVQFLDGAGAPIEGGGGWYDVGSAGTGKEVEWNFTATDSSVRINFCGAGNGSAEDAYVDNFVLIAVGGTPVEPDIPDQPDTPNEPYVPVEGDLFNNGAFETGDATGWTTYQSTAVDAIAAYTGDYGLHIVGNGGWGGLGNQTISGLEVGKTYRISLWYKALSNGVNIQLCAGTSDQGEKLAYIYGTKTEWTQFAVEFEATSTSVFFTLVGAGNNVATEMYMDDVTLTEVVLGGNDDDPNLKMIDALVDNIKTQGRTAMVGGTLMLDFSISGMEFELDCAGDVYATFNARKLASSAADGGLYFTIVVDGVALARDYCHLSSVGETKVLLAEDLPAGKHTFAIYRQSEHHFGEAGVCALSYEGEMLDKPADKDLYIEFIGDSISCGFGNLGSAAQGDGAALWSDGTQAYTYLTAQALGADWSNVAWSGIGCKYGYGTFSMQEVYPIQRYNYDKTTAYDFSKQPDIVILALGTNDNSIQTNATLKREGLVEMLTLVREKNPTAPIVWIHGMMTTGVSSMIEEIVAEFGGAEAGYYACKLTQNNAGGGAHPNLAGQQNFANELVAFLEEKGLADGIDTPDVPDQPDQPDQPDDPIVPDEDGGLLTGGETARMEMTEETVGLAFRFTLNAQGVKMDQKHVVDLTKATITVDGVEYKLLEVGAVVTNDPEIGLRENRMNRDNLSGNTKDVPAVYANDLTEEGMKYAVRVTNIPLDRTEAILYARGYYVYECDGEEIVVYGDIYAANYDDNIMTNDGVFDW